MLDFFWGAMLEFNLFQNNIFTWPHFFIDIMDEISASSDNVILMHGIKLNTRI
jgi:hypothetical protein